MLISACCLRQFSFVAVETTELFASLAGDPLFFYKESTVAHAKNNGLVFELKKQIQ